MTTRLAGGLTVADVQRRTVRTLVVSQAVGAVGVTIGVATASLLARDISGSETMAGLAQAVRFGSAAGGPKLDLRAAVQAAPPASAKRAPLAAAPASATRAPLAGAETDRRGQAGLAGGHGAGARPLP